MVRYTILTNGFPKNVDIFKVRYDMTSHHVNIQLQNVTIAQIGLCLLVRKTHLTILTRGLAPLSFHLALKIWWKILNYTKVITFHTLLPVYHPCC